MRAVLLVNTKLEIGPVGLSTKVVKNMCNGSVLSGAWHSLALQDGSRWITRSLILLLYN